MGLSGPHHKRPAGSLPTSYAHVTSLLLQVVIGNLLSHTDMQRLVKGVDYIYFSFAVQDGLLEATTIAAVVAAEAGGLGCANCANAPSYTPNLKFGPVHKLCICPRASSFLGCDMKHAYPPFWAKYPYRPFHAQRSVLPGADWP